jgi:hypothetical protein
MGTWICWDDACEFLKQGQAHFKCSVKCIFIVKWKGLGTEVCIEWSHLFFFGVTGVWVQGSVVARQALYCLSYAASPFCSGYVGERLSFFAQEGLNHDPPILCFLLPLGWQVCTTTPSLFPLRWGLANFFAQVGLEPWCSQSQPPNILEW